jgi:hypothetical protein
MSDAGIVRGGQGSSSGHEETKGVERHRTFLCLDAFPSTALSPFPEVGEMLARRVPANCGSSTEGPALTWAAADSNCQGMVPSNLRASLTTSRTSRLVGLAQEGG